MVPFAIAPSFGNAGASVVAGCLSLVLSLAPLLPGSAPRLEEAAFAARTQDDPTGIALNEFMPDPNSDWNGDGTMSDASDEYVELYNDGSVGDVDLAGWKLDDIAGGGSSEYVFPPNTILQTGGYLVVFSADTRIALNNSGDTVRLVRPDNSEADTAAYTTTAPDQAYSRTVDGGGPWTTAYPPSPGAANQPESTPTPTAMATETAPPGLTPSVTPTPSFTPTASPNPTLAPSDTPSPTAGPPPTPFPSGISLNEYMPDPMTDWNGNGLTGDADDEYIELYNAGSDPVDVGGWAVDDATGGSSPYVLPAGTSIAGGGFLVVFSAQTHIALNNTGDTVRLLRADGVEVDATSYTSTVGDQAVSRSVDGSGEWTVAYPPSPGSPNEPPPPTATPTDTSTATPSDTPTVTATPSPTPVIAETPSPTATATPNATPSSTPSPPPFAGEVSLNEFMPDPSSDWNGNGQTGDADDEYVELYNADVLSVDLGGWALDDVGSGGSPPYVLPPGTSIPAGGFLVLFSAETHLSLNNGGDSVRLVRPDGIEVEAISYTGARADQAHSKTVDGGAEWTTSYPASPGASNQPQPTATPTPSPTPSTASVSGHVFRDADGDGQFEPWLGDTGLAHVLVMLSNGRTWMTDATGWYGFRNLTPGVYAVREAQPIHMNSTTPDEYAVELVAGDDLSALHFGEMPLPPGLVHAPVILNEFLPSPASDWNGDGSADADDEWIELYNLSDAPVDLSGWFLDDVDDGRSPGRIPGGSAPYVLPPGSALAAHGYQVIFRSTSGVALNNSGDTVRLLGPGLAELEAYAFGSTRSDVAWSKTTDGGLEWTDAFPPSLGSSNQPASTPTPTATSTPETTATPTAAPTVTDEPTNTATPASTTTPVVFPDTIRLNEYLPDPATDWNGDGTADQEDEFIELFNAGPAPVDLGGWMLDDVDDSQGRAQGIGAPDGSRPFVIPVGTIVDPGGFALFYRADTGVTLNNDGDWVRLLWPNSQVAETASYTTSDDDVAVSKTVDGGSQWTRDYEPSPGLSNLPPDPTATPTVTDTPTPSPTTTPTVTDTPTPSPTATSFTMTATVTPTPSDTPGPGRVAVALNEFMSDPATDWNGDGTANQGDEYVELYNAGQTSIDLGGWMLDDVDDDQGEARGAVEPGGSRPYVIPAGTVIDPGGFALFFQGETSVVLNNNGDWVRLLQPDGTVAEATEYTSSRDDQAYSKTPDGGSQWTRDFMPSPGRSNLEVTPTSTATAAASPTTSPTGGATPSFTLTPTPTTTGTPNPGPFSVTLNEFMPDPATDWNGDNLINQDDEYVELFNAGPAPIDLGGWMLDDVDDSLVKASQAHLPSGSEPFVIPAGTIIKPEGFALFFRTSTKIALNNDGDWVRLLRPDGTVKEERPYTSSRDDQAYSRTLDGDGAWTREYLPSPGRSNTPSGTPTPSPTATASATRTPSPTPTPSGPTQTFPDGISLNEAMPWPANDWNGDGQIDSDDEYIELFNAADRAVDVGGWQLDDSPGSLAATGAEGELSIPYVIPVGTTIPARGFLVFFGSETHVGLNNTGDSVRLLWPNSVEVERFDYVSALWGKAFSKEQNGGQRWTTAYPPSPGRANDPGFTGAEQVRLNEVLSSPKDIDWDGDTAAGYLDEWIELANVGRSAARLAGWALVEGPDASTGYRYIFPAATVLEPGHHLVLYRRQSRIALTASDVTLHLLIPDGAPVDTAHFQRFAGYDQSWCRLPDGEGDWSDLCIETPGGANLPDATESDDGRTDVSAPRYDRFNHDMVSIAGARALADDVRVTLEGQVTVLPNIFDDHEIYIQDATGGMQVYLRSAEWPPLTEGQWVRVNGRMDTRYGERQIRLTRIDDIKTMQPAALPTPKIIRTGDVGETTEGWLVHLIAPASGFRGRSVVLLDDGSGAAALVFRQATGLRRPFVEIGKLWSVVGVVSQDDDEAPYDSGYGVLPRGATDVESDAESRAASTAQVDEASWNSTPLFLPVTGAADPLPSLVDTWTWPIRPAPPD